MAGRGSPYTNGHQLTATAQPNGHAHAQDEEAAEVEIVRVPPPQANGVSAHNGSRSAAPMLNGARQGVPVVAAPYVNGSAGHATVVVAASPMRGAPPQMATPAIVSAGPVRYGHMPARLSEALLALSLALGVFLFGLWAISSHTWQRTLVAGIDERIEDGRGQARPAQPGRALNAPDPLWPAPPPNRAVPQGPAEEPAARSKRTMTDPPTREVPARTLLFRETEPRR
jgi:hypothetical protein